MNGEEQKRLKSDVEYFMNLKGEVNLYNFVENLRVTYIEPRDSELKLLSERCNQLLKDKGDLTDKVKELEKQLEQEKNLNQVYEDNDRQLRELIAKMKCCGNCKNGELSAHEEPCSHCQRCFVSVEVTDQENVNDKWELAE